MEREILEIGSTALFVRTIAEHDIYAFAVVTGEGIYKLKIRAVN